MSGNTTKLYRILALSMLLPGTYAAHTASRVYNVVSSEWLWQLKEIMIR
jgi:hypothetical protein